MPQQYSMTSLGSIRSGSARLGSGSLGFGSAPNGLVLFRVTFGLGRFLDRIRGYQFVAGAVAFWFEYLGSVKGTSLGQAPVRLCKSLAKLQRYVARLWQVRRWKEKCIPD